MFKCHIEGPHAGEVAKALSQAIEKEFGEAPGVTTPGTKEDKEKADPMSIAAVILTIPPAILATADLIERRKTKKQLDVLIELVQGLREKNPDTKVDMVNPDGMTSPLDKAESEKILEAVSKNSS